MPFIQGLLQTAPGAQLLGAWTARACSVQTSLPTTFEEVVVTPGRRARIMEFMYVSVLVEWDCGPARDGRSRRESVRLRPARGGVELKKDLSSCLVHGRAP